MAGNFDPAAYGFQLARDFNKTRDLMQAREQRKQGQVMMGQIQQELNAAAAEQLTAAEELRALDERESAGEPVTQDERNRIYERATRKTIEMFETRNQILMKYSASPNEYVRQSVKPLIQQNLNAFKELGAHIENMNVQAHEEDVLAETERSNRAREATAQAQVDVQGEQVSATRERTGIMREELDIKRDAARARAPMQAVEDFLNLGKFVEASDAAGIPDDETNELLKPMGLTVDSFRDQYARFDEITRDELKQLEDREKSLVKRADEGEDVADLLASTREKKQLLVRTVDEQQRLADNRERWNREHGAAASAVAGMRDFVKSISDNFGQFAVTELPGMPGFAAAVGRAAAEVKGAPPAPSFEEARRQAQERPR